MTSKEIMESCEREVELQYPTYRVWKYESQVTLAELKEHPILNERWGNSGIGYVMTHL